MSYAALPSVTDFYTSYVNAHPLPAPGRNYQETISMFQRNSPNAATLYVGTFNLNDRVQTWQSHEAELMRACSTKQRIKRAVVILVGVAIITAGVAAMVFGGDIAYLVGAVGLLLFICITKKTLEKEVYRGIENNPSILFPAVPILFVYAMATYESRRAKKLASSKQEAVAVANYVLAKHEDIGHWLEQQKKETTEKFLQEKANLCVHKEVNPAIEGVTLDVMKVCLDDLDKIEGWKKSLAESLASAQTIPQEVLAGNG